MKRELTRQKFLKARIEKRRRKGNLRDDPEFALEKYGADTMTGRRLADRLLEQDDTIPGNRRSGFRFNYLLFIMVITPIYLWFEISFGAHLLDTISSNVTQEETDQIEHWGRLISGIAVSLLFLTGWFRTCEKWNKPWPTRILVSLAICMVCIPLTWLTEGKVIDFYIQRGSTEIALDLGGLAVAVAIGFFILRTWLRRCLIDQKHGPAVTVLGLAVILGTGVTFLSTTHLWLPQFNEKMGYAPTLAKQLGEERQQAASLSVLRRGLQEGIYSMKTMEFGPQTAASPEAKTLMALLPIIGSVIDPSYFDADRERIIRELYFRDWDQQYGGNSYSAFNDIEKDLAKLHAGSYAAASQTYARNPSRIRADKDWNEAIREILGGETLKPGLSLTDFMRDKAVSKYIGKQLACFDCEFRPGMTHEEFCRELFKWTQKHNVERTVNNFASASYFEDGRDGETAARTYWVPIWALLFSMVGAFTHLFKMLFTAAEYFQRTTFHRVHASDSLLASEVVGNSRTMIGVCIIFMTLFIYFSDNRITSDPAYLDLRDRLWKKHPVVGAVAAHWTINAQGMLYPFTKKLRPSWLVFKSDPLHWIPFAEKLVKKEE